MLWGWKSVVRFPAGTSTSSSLLETCLNIKNYVSEQQSTTPENTYNYKAFRNNAYYFITARYLLGGTTS